MSQRIDENRIDENLSGHNDAARDYVRLKSKQTGEYIDQFCTVPDNRTTEEVLDQLSRFCTPEENEEENE